MALAIVKGLSDSLKYHQLTEIKVNLIPPESQGSKLKSKEGLSSQSYQVQAELELNLSAIERLKKRAGRFVLATNDLEKKRLSSEDILKKYKGQQALERGFSFLKDPGFFCRQCLSQISPQNRGHGHAHGLVPTGLYYWSKTTSSEFKTAGNGTEKSVG